MRSTRITATLACRYTGATTSAELFSFLGKRKLWWLIPMVCSSSRNQVDDPRSFAHALTGVYATDPAYGDKLVEIMEGRGLLETFGFTA